MSTETGMAVVAAIQALIAESCSPSDDIAAALHLHRAVEAGIGLHLESASHLTKDRVEQITDKAVEAGIDIHLESAFHLTEDRVEEIIDGKLELHEADAGHLTERRVEEMIEDSAEDLRDVINRSERAMDQMADRVEEVDEALRGEVEQLRVQVEQLREQLNAAVNGLCVPMAERVQRLEGREGACDPWLREQFALLDAEVRKERVIDVALVREALMQQLAHFSPEDPLQQRLACRVVDMVARRVLHSVSLV